MKKIKLFNCGPPLQLSKCLSMHKLCVLIVNLEMLITLKQIARSLFRLLGLDPASF